MNKISAFLLYFIFVFAILFTPSKDCFSQVQVTIPLDESEQKIVNIEVVILSKDGTTQNMITVHEQIFEIEPTLTVEFKLSAVCLEAWKNPPDSTDEKGMFFFKQTENQEISQLIRTIKKLEDAISTSVISYHDGQIQFGEMESYELLELAQHCHYSPLDSIHFSAKINEQIIQCSLWQLTDKISFDDFTKILKPKTDEEKRELSDIAEMAQILLAYSGLKPTIVLRRMLPMRLKE